MLPENRQDNGGETHVNVVNADWDGGKTLVTVFDEEETYVTVARWDEKYTSMRAMHFAMKVRVSETVRQTGWGLCAYGVCVCPLFGHFVFSIFCQLVSHSVFGCLPLPVWTSLTIVLDEGLPPFTERFARRSSKIRLHDFLSVRL